MRRRLRQIDRILNLAVSTNDSFEHTLLLLGKNPDYFTRILKQRGISLRHDFEINIDSIYKKQIQKVETKYPGIITLIKKGLSGPKIGEKYDITRSRVNKIIIETGLSKNWNEKRRKLADSKKKVNPSVYIRQLHQDVRSLNVPLDSEYFPEIKSLEYRLATRKNTRSISFERVFSIFSDYQEAALYGKRLTLEELGTKPQLNAYPVDKILRKVDLAPMYTSKSPYKKKPKLKSKSF
ncbi:hypothetical protein COU54_04400 [Candidatus Pacearchaeota archaeon CG10_big_fil_rev_8_21_14_0_10_31_24]|nr:MAG: hypothetical protein COU54_04400 [Candidatus Pacearchaeota archaeon CG10_big_fil_rev_8_21_14_0_10_31_24]